jgi:maltose alpha-D-glucosyltransferase/alpha-amylase
MTELLDSGASWYKDAIFYELHVKAFYDSTGDGIGDFEGLRQKLDYLQELGISCIWILPFYKSPLRDDGYDIADYYSINPNYGTLKDFKNFLKDAHRRNIRVLTDMVVNHTSDQHAWFQEARRDPKSPKRSYYVWSDTDQKYKDARIIFTDSERSNWTWDVEAQAYYWHRFFYHQPDLNFDSPALRREMLKAMRFWLDMGIDGFRLDAVPYLYEREGTNGENLPETHAYLRTIRKMVDQHYPGRMLLAEANQWPTDVRPYFGDNDECHMAFNFPLMPRIFMALRREERTPIVDIMRQLPEIPPDCQWGMFLRNHDELTLEMVTDEERDYMYYEYAKDPRFKINVGIRRRLAPLLDNSRRRVELLHSLLYSLPGSPIMYYGDEIGMGDNVYLGDRDGVRTPMQWSGDRNAGFSRADSNRLYSPVITDPVYGYQSVNVEAQLRSSSSLLNWIKMLIRVRKQYPVFGRGGIKFLIGSNPRILAYIRHDADTSILVVCNLSRFVQPCELDLREYAGSSPVELIGNTYFPPIGELPYFITLGPHDFYWFRLEKRPVSE